MTSPAWRKSSRSDTQGNDCVELARLTDAIGIRDSKHPQAGHLTVSVEVFGDLLDKIRSGRHSL